MSFSTQPGMGALHARTSVGVRSFQPSLAMRSLSHVRHESACILGRFMAMPFFSSCKFFSSPFCRRSKAITRTSCVYPGWNTMRCNCFRYSGVGAASNLRMAAS